MISQSGPLLQREGAFCRLCAKCGKLVFLSIEDLKTDNPSKEYFHPIMCDPKDPNVTETKKTVLPATSEERKKIPLARGLLDYFPAALSAVANVSRTGNEQHNPGQEMHHARGKSSDHADCILRHLMDRGTLDSDGLRHTAKVAWRALALLQEELEAAGAPMARGAKVESEK